MSSLSSFVASVRSFVENTSLEVHASSLVGEVFYDDLAKSEFCELHPNVSFENIDDEKTTIAQLHASIYGLTAPIAESLVFHRLLHGVDLSVISKSSVNAMEQMRFNIAKQMKNITYVIGEGSEIMLVDPCWDIDGCVNFLKLHNLKCIGSICTHYHFDHVGGILPNEILARLGLPPAMMEMARRLPGIRELKAPVCFMHEADSDAIKKQTEIDSSKCRLTKHDDVINIGAMRVRVLHTPGHSPGKTRCFREYTKRGGEVIRTGQTVLRGKREKNTEISSHGFPPRGYPVALVGV